MPPYGLKRFRSEVAIMPIRRQTVLYIVAFTLGTGLLFAQTTVTSTILGTVTDPQGAAIPNAQVLLSETATGRQWKTTTGAEGQYVFPDLNAGTYKVEAQSSGFQTTQSTPVTIGAAGTTQRIDVSLRVSGSTESVTVSAAQVQLDDVVVHGDRPEIFEADLPEQGRGRKLSDQPGDKAVSDGQRRQQQYGASDKPGFPVAGAQRGDL